MHGSLPPSRSSLWLACVSGGWGIFLHLLIEEEAPPTLWVCHPPGSQSPCIQPVAGNTRAMPGGGGDPSSLPLTFSGLPHMPTPAKGGWGLLCHWMSRSDEQRVIFGTRHRSLPCSGYSMRGGRKKEQFPAVSCKYCPASGLRASLHQGIHCFLGFQKVSGSTLPEAVDCISRGFSYELKGKPQTGIRLSTKPGRWQPNQV